MSVLFFSIFSVKSLIVTESCRLSAINKPEKFAPTHSVGRFLERQTQRKKWQRKINASFATSVFIFQRLHRSNCMRIFIQKDIQSKRNWFAWHFFTFTTFVIQWKIDFRSTCCFRLKKTFFFLFGKKTERGKWKQHKVANRKLQMLHCIMQMLRLITAQKLKTFSYFPNATTSHTYTNSTYQNLIKTLSKTYFFSCDLSDSASKVVQRIVKSNKNSNVFNFLRRQFQ